MSGDLAIEVAMDIEYRIGRAHQCAKKFLRLRTYFLHKSKGTLTLRGVLLNWLSHRVISCKDASKILTRSSASTERSKTMAAKLMKQVTNTQLTC